MPERKGKREAMKAAKLRELNNEELAQQCADMERDLLGLTIRKSASQVEQPSRIRSLRRSIARARTVMKERRSQQGS
jgi:large subunit ribosomal protein L29